MLKKSRQLLKEQYPGNEFHIIIWDWTDRKDKKVFEALKENGMHLHYIEDILPGGDKANMQYKIHKYDHHPNREAHAVIAGYVVDQIIRKK